jgi:predicted histone-like DNA-binding protein
MLKFKIVARPNPRDRTLPEKYYLSVISQQNVDLDYIARDISEKSSLSEGDVMSVVTSLIKLIPRELSYGRTVSLGDMGTFRLTVSSEGAETREEVGTDLIRKVNFRFRPTSKCGNAGRSQAIVG